jgi:hypothetical protein
MNEVQQAIVREHISDLFRDGEALRAERWIRSKERAFHEDVGRTGRPGGNHYHNGHRPMRVRLGRWLIGVGAAVAGPNGDSANCTAGHAA